MKKFIKSTVAVASAMAMAVTMAATPTITALAEDAPATVEQFVPDTMAEGEAHYTVAGGFGEVNWDPLAKAVEMKAVEGMDGVYSFKASLPAFDLENEYLNRFKICKIDNTILDAGWSGSVCVGTTTYADNQSQIRILNQAAGIFTIYFDTATGAVVVKDEKGADVALSISWVGYDSETQFMTPEEITASTLETWPADKVKVDAVPDVKAINEALSGKISNFVPDTMAEGEAHYTVAGGFGASNWNPLAKNVEMKEIPGSNGIYYFEAELPAYDAENEYLNRFKICKIDNTILDAGWSGSLCVGTTTYADNQSQIRILNEAAGKYTIVFDSTTGGVVVRNAGGDLIPLSISWVGYDSETQFMTEAEVTASTLETWPADKVKVDAVPNLTEINAALAGKLNIEPDSLAAGETYYTVAGGFGPVTWKPLGKLAIMDSTAWEGVYSFTTELPAYDAENEYLNRFKICKIDNTILDEGWSGSLCVGTTTYADNQSQIRVLNQTAGIYTIYFDTATGAVVVKDSMGNNVELSISWVGYDSETQFMTEAEVTASTLATWPADKVKVDAVPNLTEINAALTEKLTKTPEPIDPEPPVLKASLKLNMSKKTLYTGKDSNTVTIKATVKGESSKVTWKSTKTSVATVSSKGKVTAKKAGTATISAKANGITKKVTITVKNPTITVKSGSKKVSSASVKKGKSASLTVTTSPKKAGFKAACADSKSKKIVKVSTKNSKVTVKGLKKGTAKVKITSGAGSKNITVKVK